MGRSAQAGVSNPDSPAGKAGIKTGDRIAEVNGTPVTTWEEIEAAYAQAPAGAKLMLRDQKPSGTEEKMVELVKPDGVNVNQGMGEAWGLYSSELFVDKTVDGSPAAKAGLIHGDRLVAIGDQSVESFMDLKDAVQASGEKSGKVFLKWERDGKTFSQEIVPTATAAKDAEMKSTTQYTVGVAPMLVLAEPATVVERIYNPFTLIWKGTERMVTFTWRNFVSIGKMFTGNVSVGTLGGPILIGKIAGESLSHGLVTFLTTMAILSIGLGVLNLLPVPILDGGHIVLLWIESARGKPLSMRQMEIIQGVGLVLILALMGVVMKNDITRLISL
jgi:regulator of sigma E protease